MTFTPRIYHRQRDGVQLAGEAIVTVNADLRVGQLTETITVPASRRSSTCKHHAPAGDDEEVIDTLPTGRNYRALASFCPESIRQRAMVGGAAAIRCRSSPSTAASPAISVSCRRREHDDAAGQRRPGDRGPQSGMASEVTIDTRDCRRNRDRGASASLHPRDGGNTFTARCRHICQHRHAKREPDRRSAIARAAIAHAIKTTYDGNPGLAVPIKRDRIWFYFTGRVNRADQYPSGAFVNVNGYDPNNYTVVYDTTQRAYSRALWADAQVRVTTQASPRNKVAFTWDQQTRCSCLAGPGTPSAGVLSATVTPEAAANFRSPTQRLLHGEWSRR